ncbi:unnamed protein product [Calypogeia fissa]
MRKCGTEQTHKFPSFHGKGGGPHRHCGVKVWGALFTEKYHHTKIPLGAIGQQLPTTTTATPGRKEEKHRSNARRSNARGGRLGGRKEASKQASKQEERNERRV